MRVRFERIVMRRAGLFYWRALGHPKRMPKMHKNSPTHKRKHGVQVAAARAKAAALFAAPQTVRLLDKHEVCALANVTYPTIWSWQRAGTFPRSRIVGGKSMWLSNEVEAWMAALPVRPLKGDEPSVERRDG
jgi:predicted DNA-binding transcriptional regulator AlpA